MSRSSLDTRAESARKQHDSMLSFFAISLMFVALLLSRGSIQGTFPHACTNSMHCTYPDFPSFSFCNAQTPSSRNFGQPHQLANGLRLAINCSAIHIGLGTSPRWAALAHWSQICRPLRGVLPSASDLPGPGRQVPCCKLASRL